MTRTSDEKAPRGFDTRRAYGCAAQHFSSLPGLTGPD
jgi:hypothetical protein